MNGGEIKVMVFERKEVGWCEVVSGIWIFTIDHKYVIVVSCNSLIDGLYCTSKDSY